MKKIFSLILAMMAISFSVIADDSGSKSNTPIAMDYHPIDNNPTPTIHRAPMRISVEAYYDAWTQTITVRYDGEATGEVKLYKDGLLIDNSSEINTNFIVTESGLYTIEIVTDSWSAIGSFDIL